VVVGSSSSTDEKMTNLSKDSTDAVISEYSPTGSVNWTRTFGGSSVDTYNKVELTTDGGLVAVGDSDSDHMRKRE
jgi:hypothetical protein